MTEPFYSEADEERQQITKADIISLLLEVKQVSQKPLAKMISEWWKLSKGAGKLRFSDYVHYQLYDDDKYDASMRNDFISDDVSVFWPIAHTCNDQMWQIASEDKWLMSSLLVQHNFPVAKTHAVIDPKARSYGNFEKIDTIDALAMFLSADTTFPLFLKPVNGIGSFGVFLVTGFQDKMVSFEDRESLPIDEFWTLLEKNNAYLIQPKIENHPDITKFSKSLATIRCYNFLDGDNFTVPFTLMKIPASGNIADNFWRSGNMMADIDPISGKFNRVISGTGTKLQVLTKHPENDENFQDFAVPCWQDVLNLNEAVSRLFSPIRFSSTDIAITPDGPLIIEVNFGGSFELPQLASGKGFLTPEIRAFLKKYGVSL